MLIVSTKISENITVALFKTFQMKKKHSTITRKSFKNSLSFIGSLRFFLLVNVLINAFGNIVHDEPFSRPFQRYIIPFGSKKLR